MRGLIPARVLQVLPLLIGFLAAGVVHAQADPRVAARAEGYLGYQNLDVELFGQTEDEDAFQGGGSGSVSLVISDFYLQGDVFGDAAEFDGADTELVGGGGHIGWRDAELGAAGVAGTYGEQEFDSGAEIEQWRVGFEGELFLDRVTLAANVGHAASEAGGNDVNAVYVDGAIGFYPMPRARLQLMGGAFDAEDDDPIGIVGASGEFLALDPLGLFLRWEGSIFDGGAFEVQQHSVVVGARLYWGADEPSLVAYDRSRFKPSCFGYQISGSRYC